MAAGLWDTSYLTRLHDRCWPAISAVSVEVGAGSLYTSHPQHADLDETEVD